MYCWASPSVPVLVAGLLGVFVLIWVLPVHVLVAPPMGRLPVLVMPAFRFVAGLLLLRLLPPPVLRRMDVLHLSFVQITTLASTL